MRSTLKRAIGVLSAALDVPVYSEAPKSRPDSFVLVDSVGGTPSMDALHHDHAIQAWSTTFAGAESLMRDACDAMRAAGDATSYADPVSLGTDGAHHVWQATYTIHALW